MIDREKRNRLSVLLRQLGSGALGEKGNIDFAYIRPSSRGCGIFRVLFESIERLAREKKEVRLWVHASLMAEPAFKAMGFAFTKRETVEFGDQLFDRIEMEKYIVLG